MLQLSKNFYITAIEPKNTWNSSLLEQEYEYTFRYKNFKIELSIQFEIIGYTKKDNIAIINFGYSVDIEKWSNKEQYFLSIEDVDSIDGKSTKKYLDSQDAREILLRFIEKRIDKYLQSVTPTIMIRGALSEIKVSIPRYKRLDTQFFNHQYHKKEFDVKSADALYKISAGIKSDEDKVIWAYSQNDTHFEKLSEVFK